MPLFTHSLSFTLGHCLAVLLISISVAASADEPVGLTLDRSLDEIRALEEAAEGRDKMRLGVIRTIVAVRGLPVPESLAMLQSLDPDTVRIELGDAWYWALISLEGWLKARQSKLDQAGAQCQTALDNIATITEPAFRALTYSCLSFVALRRGDQQTALANMTQSVELAEQGQSFVQYSGALSNEALILYYLGMYDASIKRFEQLVSMEDQLDITALRIVRFNLGLVYLDVGEYEQALSAFEEGIRWTGETGQTHRQLIAHTYHAKALIALDRPAEAISTLAPWVQSPSVELDQDSVTNAFLTSATAHLASSQPDQALQQSEAGLELSNPVRMIDLILVKARALRALGMTQPAIDSITQVLGSARQANHKTLPALLGELADLLATQGRFEDAYRAQVERTKVTEANNEAELARQYATLESIHALEKTRREMSLLEANIARDAAESERRYLVLLAVLASAVVVLVIAFLIRERQTQRREIDRARTEAERLESIVATRTIDLEARIAEVMEQRSELVELQKQLDEADKMRAIGTLTGGVAHDFNNLLTVILGSASILENQADLTEEERTDLVRAITTAGETGAGVTGSLLSYARRQPLNPRRICIAECINNSRLLFERAVSTERKLAFDLAPGDCKVDEGALITAVMNLLINASDASPRGATVTISGTADTAANMYYIDVTDEGHGMTDLQVEHAFEPFYSTKSSTLATGLGLSMAHGFAHQSGGEIAINSEPDVGTTVRLGLPLMSEETTSVHTTDHGTPRPESLNVICVDDNVTILRTMTRLLQTLGHDVRGFTNSDAALMAIDEIPPELLVSDVLMPEGLSGIELADQALSLAPSMRVLLVSGFTDAADTSHTLLRKPFSLEELGQAIDSVFTQH